MRVKFKVFNDIVFGLKYCNVVKKSGIVVEKYEEIMGTFAPTTQIHIVSLTPEETPTGFFARGTYKGKSMFIDNDGIVHM
jgi:Rho GDP-dissociation inhibitor